MISERNLKQWRKEALQSLETFDPEFYKDTSSALAQAHQYNLTRILRMTQELLDLHLIKK